MRSPAQRPLSVSSRIVHVVPALFGWENVFGGGERYALELARAMARRVPTRLVSFGSRSASLRIDDLEVRVLRNWFPYRRFRFDPFTPALLRELSAADVIHVHRPHTLMGPPLSFHAKASGRALFSSHLGGYGLGLHRLTAVDRFFDGHLHISEFSRQHSGHAALSNSRTILGGTDVATFRPPTEPTERREVASLEGSFLTRD